MEKIQTRMIMEILGRPKEHIVQALTTLIDKLAVEKGVKLTGRLVHDPIEVQNTKNLFTTFAEINLDFDSIQDIMQIIFAYMPANIEIIHPEKIILKNEDFNFLGNKLIQRLHEYDAVVKNTINQQQILTNKLREVAPHLFVKKDKKISEKKPEKKQKKSKKEKKTKE